MRDQQHYEPIALADRLAGGIWGHLVGDALGVPYEFRRSVDIGEVIWGHERTHGQPTGTWSDDGGLTLALLDSLPSVGFDTTDQAQRFLRWSYLVGYSHPPTRGLLASGGLWLAIWSASDPRL